MEIITSDKIVIGDLATFALDPENLPVVARPLEKSPYQGYIPVSPVKTDLRVLSGGSQLEVWGRILNLTDGRPISSAGIELWHLSPISDKRRRRAKLITDRRGSYRFITDLPGREMGKDYIVYFKISYMGQSHFTKLSFNNARARLAARALEKYRHQTKRNDHPSDGWDPNRAIFQFDICLSA